MSYHCDHQLHHHHHNHYHHHHHYDQDYHDPYRNIAGPKICQCWRRLMTDYEWEVNPALLINIAPTFKTLVKLFSLHMHHLYFIDNWKKAKILWAFSLWLDGLCLTWCHLSSLLWDLPCTVLVRSIIERERGYYWKLWHTNKQSRSFLE